jgi:uncharacterized membrane protein YccC
MVAETQSAPKRVVPMRYPYLRRFVPTLASSARTALAATLSFVVARLVGLSEAYWAAISTLIVMQSTLGGALTISAQRFAGTIVGAFVAGWLASSFPQSWWILWRTPRQALRQPTTFPLRPLPILHMSYTTITH